MASEQCIAASLVRSVWLEQPKYEAAERHYYEVLAERHSGLKIEGKAISVPPTKPATGGSSTDAPTKGSSTVRSSSISDFIGETRDMIEQTLRASVPQPTTAQRKLEQRVAKLEEMVDQLTKRVAALEANRSTGGIEENQASKQEVEEEEEDDDTFDLFGSDDEDDKAAEELKQRRLAEYQEKKSSKPKVTAKSTIILDVKPWDDETDMKDIERCVRSVETDGLVWGQSKLIPLAYGIHKLQIACVVEDDKVGTDFLEEEITKFDDLVQSVDIAAFNKI